MGQQTDGAPRGGGLDKAGQAEIEGRTGSAAAAAEVSAEAPTAGPHAEPSLTNPEATPGAGSLPSPSAADEAAAGTG